MYILGQNYHQNVNGNTYCITKILTFIYSYPHIRIFVSMCFLENISLVQNKKQKKAAFRLKLSFLQNIRRLLKNLEVPRFHSVPFPKHFKLKEMRGQKLIDGASIKHLITKYFQNVHFFFLNIFFE